MLTAHRLPDVTVSADAGMISAPSQKAIEAATTLSLEEAAARLHADDGTELAIELTW